MSTLALPKRYSDLTLLYAAYIHELWDTLEAKVNGNIDRNNVQTGFATWAQVTLQKDVNFYFGAAGAAFFQFINATGELMYTHTLTGKNTIFNINGTEVARVDPSKNFTSKKELYFPSDTNYGLYSLVARYRKPLLVYNSSTQIDLENNTEFSNESLVVLPYGPIAVAEDLASTHKFRRCIISNTANGYATGHVGAAQGGVRVGLVLTANTWYFMYAVRVQFGADAGNKFIMVLSELSPKYSNFSALDTLFGASQWVYLGAVRYGMGSAQTTTLCPFVMDKSGWTYFTSRAAATNFFGINVLNNSLVNSTSYVSKFTFNAANSGNAVPDTCSIIQCRWFAIFDSVDISGVIALGTSTSNILHQLPTFSSLFDNTAHADDFKIPNGKGYQFLAKRYGSSSFNYDLTLTISGFLDDYV
jgi:hypothetical protein